MLVTILVLLLIIGLALYAVQILPIDSRIALLLQLVIIVIAIIYLLRFIGRV